MNVKIRIIQAGTEHLDMVADLFNQYRVFYKQENNPEGAKAFIGDRMTKSESVIFLAVATEHDMEKPAGFAQLYPFFTSVGMKRKWVLNDLFVTREFRRIGIGEHLINKVIQFGRSTGAASLSLETSKDNSQAKALYEKLDFQMDELFDHYELDLSL